MLYDNLPALHTALRAGQTTCAAQLEGYLARIAARPSLNAFLEVFPESARAQAQQIDSLIQAKGLEGAGPLAGLILGIKDNIVYQDHSVTASSKILGGFKSLFTATALQRLIDAGAIVIGRLNCDEFALGSSNENSAYGPVRNPWNEAHVPGGSSGGSAAAVAAGLCMATLGTDTGGSVRQPASFCGVPGIKPTYGRVSRYGAIACASSFDQIGVFAHTVADCGAILQVMSGNDPLDTTSAHQPVGNIIPSDGSQTYRVAILQGTLDVGGLDLEVAAAANQLISDLKAAGHTVETVPFPYLDVLVPTYYVLMAAELSSNLARFDGIRYGYRATQFGSLDELYRRSRTEGFGTEVKRRIMLGTFVLSSGYYDAYYTKAQQVRRLLRDATRDILTQYDFILTPTAPSPAFPIGEKANDPIAMYLSDIFTVHANLAGVPGISFPYAQHSNGLPIGMQLLAGSFQEAKLLQLAHQIARVPAPLPVG